MSGATPVWFLPRTRDRPPDGAITLGDIIASPWEPEEPINEEPPPAIEPTDLRTREEPSWSWTKEYSRSTGGGLFAAFLNVAAIGPDLQATIDTARRELYTADRLVTRYFIPDMSYIQHSMRDPGVIDALSEPNRKKRVYMITGIKMAYGATFVADAMKKHSIHVQIGVDATSFGVPITFGPKGHYASGNSETHTTASSDFVFGYQLRELRLKRGQVQQKRHEKGALYGQNEFNLADDVFRADDYELQDVALSELGATHQCIADETGTVVECVSS